MKLAKYNKINIDIDMKSKTITFFPNEIIFNKITNSLKHFASYLTNTEFDQRL